MAVIPPLKRVNCAGCEVELIGESGKEIVAGLKLSDRMKLPDPIAGRIKGRPYCQTCLDERIPSVLVTEPREPSFGL
jgi:hypothetical protein